MEDWKLPWTGGCRCDRLRFEVSKAPILTSACHCSGCQKMSASAYSLTLTVPSDGFSLTRGEPVPGGLKGPVSHHFHCPDCFSWVFTQAEGFDSFVNVRPTMLDEPGWFEPFIELWTSEKLPWAHTGARHSYETSPGIEEFEPLMAAFASEGRGPSADRRR
ncbi:MAG: GFA family protein [Allosphingosinicella sp.]